MKVQKIIASKFLKIGSTDVFESSVPLDTCILLGENGSGKSLLLEQIAHSALRTFAPKLQEIRSGLNTLDNPFLPLKISIEFDTFTSNLEFKQEQAAPVFTVTEGNPKSAAGKIIYIPTHREIKPNQNNYIEDLKFYENQKVSQFEQNNSQNFEKILVNLSNKVIQADYHKYAQVTERETLERIKRAYAKMFPNISLKGAFGSRFIVSKDGFSFPVSSLSHGEKQALVLFSFIAKEEELKDSILLLDEPEIGLAKDLRTRLVDSLRELNPDYQIIICSHSKEIIDSIPVEKRVLLT